MPYLHKITVIDDRLSNLGGNGTQPIREDFDLPRGYGHTLQRSVEELNEVNEIKREGALSFALPKSPKNRHILDRFEWASIGGQRYKALKVEVWVGHIQLRFDSLLVSSNSDRESQYDCQLVDGGDFWLEKADKTYLKDLDFGTFEYTEANVLDNMENNSQWQSGNDLIWFPLADFGNGGNRIAFSPNNVNIDDGGSGTDTITLPDHGLPIGTGNYFQVIISSDGTPPAPFQNNNIYLFSVVDENKLLSLIQISNGGSGQHYATLNRWDIRHIRPFFSVPGLLMEGFKQIGWQLKGEILGHSDVRHWWDYILAKDFYNTQGNENYYFFLAERNTEQIANSPFIIQFDSAVQEAYGSLVDDVPTGFTNADYLNDTGQKLEAEITATLLLENISGNNATFSFQLSVYEENTPTADELYRQTAIQVLLPSTPTTVELTLQAELRPNNIANITAAQIAGAPINIKVLASTSLRVQPQKYPKYIVKNSTHENAKMIASDITLLDRLKGFVHLADLKIKTDFHLKTVHLYPAENTTYEGEPLEGFWKPTSEARDMTAYIEKDSRILTPPTDEQPRFVHLKFQDSTDDYITDELTPDEQTGLHGRTLDFGERFTGEDLAIENPLYEPTAEKQAGGAIVPALWDNSNSKESYNIKPRIVYGIGWVRQQLKSTYTAHSNSQGNPTDPYVVDESFWYFEGQYMVYVPYASQLPETTVFVLPDPPYLPEKNIVYGTRGNDLYNGFYTLDRFVRPLLPEIAFLVRMTLEGFTSEGFRHRWYIIYNGEPAFYRLSKLLNHETNNDESTEAVLLPEYIE